MLARGSKKPRNAAAVGEQKQLVEDGPNVLDFEAESSHGASDAESAVAEEEAVSCVS